MKKQKRAPSAKKREGEGLGVATGSQKGRGRGEEKGKNDGDMRGGNLSRTGKKGKGGFGRRGTGPTERLQGVQPAGPPGVFSCVKEEKKGRRGSLWGKKSKSKQGFLGASCERTKHFNLQGGEMMHGVRGPVKEEFRFQKTESPEGWASAKGGGGGGGV